MNSNYVLLDAFEFSTEAQIVKTRLNAEGIDTILKDEKTIDSDPLISQALGGVKLYVHKEYTLKAIAIYDTIRTYEVDSNGNAIHCVNCASTKILIAPLARKNIFYMLFPFFESTRYICNSCKTIFK